MNNKYNEIIAQLEEALNTKELGELFTRRFNECITVFSDEDIDEATKNHWKASAENYLTDIRDFPNKKGRIR